MSHNRPVFVRSDLDDYGLTPIQFRIYCHIARRDGPKSCFASVDSMAKVCRVNPNSVWRALRFLKDHGLIEAARRPGETTLYKITPISAWLLPDHPPQNNRRAGRPKIYRIATKTATHPKVIADTHTETMGTHQSQNNSRKGNPYEGNPIESTPYETGHLHAPQEYREKSKGTKTRLPSVPEVLKFTLTKAGFGRSRVDKWLTPNLNRISTQAARATLNEQDDDNARDALARAFRFIYYNNRKGWQLTDSWQAAYSGFAEKADYGAGPASVPLDWIPQIDETGSALDG